MKLPYITVLTLGLMTTPLWATEDAKTTTATDKPVAAETKDGEKAAADKPQADEKKAEAAKPSEPVKASESSSKYTTDKDKLSYTFGHLMGNSLKQQNAELNMEVLFQAIKDVVEGKDPALERDEISKIWSHFQQERRTKQMAELKKQGEENLKAGEKFLEENKKKEGIVTTASGLQYKEVKAGNGKIPKADDTVTVHYKGTLIDGTEFDSSYSRGEPATFPVSGVIEGWKEALQLMKEGAKWQLFVPAKLAYGERGPGGKIGPNATLVFDVELISIQEKKAEEDKGAATTEEKADEKKPADAKDAKVEDKKEGDAAKKEKEETSK